MASTYPWPGRSKKEPWQWGVGCTNMFMSNGSYRPYLYWSLLIHVTPDIHTNNLMSHLLCNIPCFFPERGVRIISPDHQLHWFTRNSWFQYNYTAIISKYTVELCKYDDQKILYMAVFFDQTTKTRWWFQIFFIFTSIWGRFPFWLIFFRWVETTNLKNPGAFVVKDLLRDFWGRSDGHQSNEFDPCIQPHHAGCVRVTWTTRGIISKTYFSGGKSN